MIALLAIIMRAAAGSTASITPDGLEADRADSPRLEAALPMPTEHVGTVPPVSPAPPHPQNANPLWAVPLSALAGTRDRPIFSSSRRPPPSAVAPVAAPRPVAAAPKPREPERPQLSLVGTIAGDSESFGIFLNQGTTGALRLKVGEDFQGWTLRSVQGRAATLEKNEQTVVLTLPQPGAVPQAGQPLVRVGLQPTQGPPSAQPLSSPQRARGPPRRQM